MYVDHQERIEEIITNGYEFRFGDYLSRGFEILQKELGYFILFALLMFVVSWVLEAIPYVGSLVEYLVVSPVLVAGFYLTARKLDLGQRIEFGDLFKGIDHIGQLVLTALVEMLVIVVSILPFLLAISAGEIFDWVSGLKDGNFDFDYIPDFPAWSLLLLPPVLYFGVAYIFAIQFVVFYNFSFWDALEYSRRIVTKHWFAFFGFSLLMGLIIIGGVLLLCVGVLAAVPVAYCCLYAAFADITQMDIEPDEHAGIEQHLIN